MFYLHNKRVCRKFMRRRRLYLKMQEKLTGIALGSVKHSDRHDIATLYTLERGRVAVAVAAGGGRRRRTPLMPLSVVELNGVLLEKLLNK